MAMSDAERRLRAETPILFADLADGADFHLLFGDGSPVGTLFRKSGPDTAERVDSLDNPCHPSIGIPRDTFIALPEAA